MSDVNNNNGTGETGLFGRPTEHRATYAEPGGDTDMPRSVSRTKPSSSSAQNSEKPNER
ncbi:hypothetical protein SEA_PAULODIABOLI_211 [Microbacterium phage PauloDiaboli]|nr:hypothetical protein SEA_PAULODIABOLI_211 [Microbacterium phage PauloDiaboli]